MGDALSGPVRIRVDPLDTDMLIRMNRVLYTRSMKEGLMGCIYAYGSSLLNGILYPMDDSV